MIQVALIEFLDQVGEHAPVGRLPGKGKIAACDRVDGFTQTKAKTVDVVKLVGEGDLHQVDGNLPPLAEASVGVVTNVFHPEVLKHFTHGTYTF